MQNICILTMRWRNDNMLLRIAQGDAYGMAREYVKTKEHPEHVVECLKLERYLQHPSYHKLPAGSYTDDTQMSLGVAEALLESYNAKDVTHERFVELWYQAFKRDPRDGYSRVFQSLLEQAQSAEALRASLKPDSTKNGAAMRSVPLGVISDVNQLKAVAMRQAGTTHATYEGVTSSVLVALMSHFALYDRRGFLGMTGWLETHLPLAGKFREAWVGPVQAKCDNSPYDVGINTAWAVHTLLTTQDTLMGIMRQTVAWGGDTDSVAAIAWGIASCRMQDEELPAFLEDDLERVNGSSYGPQYLKTLGRSLMDAYDKKGGQHGS